MPGSISTAAFRESLARFASGVTVVTARGPRGRFGLTATAFTSVSLDPPLVLVCVNKQGGTHDELVAADLFGVSVLAESQAWVAAQFARRAVDRFAGVRLRDPHALAGPPLVEGALAQLVCRPHARTDAGDHTICVGRVIESAFTAGRPLIHFARTFGAFVSANAGADAAVGGRA